MINFTLPFSEISPINHPKLGLCAGSPFRPTDKSLPGSNALLRPCLTPDVAAKEVRRQTHIAVMGSVLQKKNTSKRGRHMQTQSAQ